MRVADAAFLAVTAAPAAWVIYRKGQVRLRRHVFPSLILFSIGRLQAEALFDAAFVARYNAQYGVRYQFGAYDAAVCAFFALYFLLTVGRAAARVWTWGAVLAWLVAGAFLFWKASVLIELVALWTFGVMTFRKLGASTPNPGGVLNVDGTATAGAATSLADAQPVGADKPRQDVAEP